MEIDAKLEDAFCQAIIDNNINEAESLIEEIINSLKKPQYRNFYNYYGDKGIDELIFEYSTDIITQIIDRNQLLLEDINPETLNYLLTFNPNINIQDDNGYTALMSAIERNHDNIQILIDHGANVNLADNQGDTPLMMATSFDFEIIYNLIKNGADINAVNKQGETILMILFGNFRRFRNHQNEIFNLLQYLISNGANADIPTQLIIAISHDFLNLAISYGDLNMIKYLIERGGNVNITNNRNENLLFSVINSSSPNRILMMDYLIRNGININEQNIQGFTPLMYAIIYCNNINDVEIIEYLINNGADINTIKNNRGFTAYDMVVFSFNKFNILELLTNKLDEKNSDPSCILM
jgi:ankyrin repeat protein